MTWEYDLAGNLTRGQAADGSWQLMEYDSAGGMMSVKRESDGLLLQGNQYGSSRQRVAGWNYVPESAPELIPVDFRTANACSTDVQSGRKNIYMEASRIITFSKKFLFLIPILSATMVIYYFVTGNFPLVVEAPITDAEKEQVRTYCRELQPPPFFRKVDESEVVKSNAALVSVDYKSDVDPREVKTYFLNLPELRNWEFEEKYGSGTAELHFYNGKFFITISYVEFSLYREREFEINCGWRNDRYGIIGDLLFR